MKKLLPIALAAAMLSTAAIAQQQEKEFELKVTTSDVGLLDKALRKLPYEEVVNLMTKLNSQLTAQIKPVVIPEPKAEPKKE